MSFDLRQPTITAPKIKVGYYLQCFLIIYDLP